MTSTLTILPYKNTPTPRDATSVGGWRVDDGVRNMLIITTTQLKILSKFFFKREGKFGAMVFWGFPA